MADGLVADERIWKCVIGMRVHEQQIQTGFHLRETSVSDQSGADVVDAVKTWVDANFRPYFPNAMTFERIEAVELTSKAYGQAEYVNTVGGLAVPMQLTFLAVNIGLRTGTRRRYENGRMFWPSVVNDTIVNGKLSNDAWTQYNTMAASFATTFTGASFTHDLKCCIVTRPRPQMGDRPALTHSYTDVIAVRPNRIVTALGRRNLGRGS